METPTNIALLTKKNDNHRLVFEEFIINYQPTLKRAEEYLDDITRKIDPAFAEAYIPWKIAVHDLLKGVYLIAKKIPLQSKEKFMDALQIFSFESAVAFLADILTICHIKLERDWAEKFRIHISNLQFALANLNQKQQHSFVH